MANNYFRFKQFTVFQDDAAMKVGTDGVLLGSWAGIDGSQRRVLDIGTGTGLLALMVAQRATEASVDAVEIDPGAARQARENVRQSPWAEHIVVYQNSIQDFAAESTVKYDHILCNPPFFTGSLKAPVDARTTARHNDALSVEDLAAAVGSLLDDDGRFSVIYPPNEAVFFEKAAQERGLYLTRQMPVRGTPEAAVKRILMEFSFRPATSSEEQELVIELSRNHYTEEYKRLTRDFYLKF